ncbi:MAG: hypothetical protein U0575_09745 [Phycisphaerales bacterium]
MRLFIASLPLAVVATAVCAPMSSITSTWNGGPSGNWNVAGNWSPSGVPNNGGGNTYDVVIDGNVGTASAVSLTNLSPAVATITIGGNDSLSVGNNLVFFLTGGSLSNAGLLTLNSTGNTTDFRIDLDTTFSGAGTFRGSNTQANRFYGASNAVRLTNATGHTIAGSMTLGVNQLRLTNAGVVDTDVSGGILLDLTDGAGLNFNSGTLRASNGAKLTLQNFTLDNTGGTIEAAAGSFVDLTGMSITGGTIRDADGAGPGVVRNTNSLTLTNVTLDGPFAQPNNTLVDLNGAIQMPSTYTVGSTGNTTDLRFNTSPFTLMGGGELLCTNTQANRIFGINNGVTLVVPADFWLHGSMQLGVNQMRLDNQSSIDADSSQGITVDLTDGAGINFNSGTLRASNGAKLTLQNFTLDNTGGTIEAAAGSFVDLTGMSISGGTIRDADGTGPGVVRNTNTLTLTNVTLDGPFTQPNNTLVVLNGAMQFLSTYTVNSIGNTTDLRADTSPFTIQGGGEIVFSNSQSNRFYGVNGATRIVNAVGNTVRGSFQLGANQGAFTNHGAFIADASQGITIDVTDSQDFTTDGVLWASVGNITINPGPFFNGGAVLINAGRTISRAGAYTQTAGGTSVDGTLALSGGGTMQLQGGTLSGNGQVTGGLVNNTGGTVAPGSSAGLLSLGAGYTQAVNGALDVQIGGLVPGTQYDQLAVTGNASLAGTLRVSRINGFLPVPSDEFTILTTTGTRTGTFGIVESCDDVSVVYGTNFVKVKFTTSFGIPGDLNNDGVVDGADLGGLLAAWGPCIDPCCVADLNGDSTVDGGDLGILLANWS